MAKLLSIILLKHFSPIDQVVMNVVNSNIHIVRNQDISRVLFVRYYAHPSAPFVQKFQQKCLFRNNWLSLVVIWIISF